MVRIQKKYNNNKKGAFNLNELQNTFTYQICPIKENILHANRAHSYEIIFNYNNYKIRYHDQIWDILNINALLPYFCFTDVEQKNIQIFALIID